MEVIQSGHLTQSFGLSHQMIAAEVGQYKLGDVTYRLTFAANIFATP
jgi:hypothetical protein